MYKVLVICSYSGVSISLTKKTIEEAEEWVAKDKKGHEEQGFDVPEYVILFSESQITAVDLW